MTTDHQGAEALKPCPFCGGTEMQIGMLGHADDCYFALHERLRKAPPADLSMLPYVHAAWNRRPAPASDLRAAAQAVVDRWDSPQWKDEPHTAEFINRLRRALEAPGGGEDQA